MKPEDVRTVGIVGCGLMGSGIAEVVARAGAAVTFVEASEDLAARGRERIEASLERAVERGKITPQERAEALGRIRGVLDLAALGDVDLVIEATTEDVEAKFDVFRRLGELTRPETVLASNTSSIPIADLGAASGRPDRVIGMHFFNPPPVMKLLEIIPAITTSDETSELARGFGERLGKTCVRSADRAGFIVNRLLIPYLNSAPASWTRAPRRARTSTQRSPSASVIRWDRSRSWTSSGSTRPCSSRRSCIASSPSRSMRRLPCSGGWWRRDDWVARQDAASTTTDARRIVARPRPAGPSPEACRSGVACFPLDAAARRMPWSRGRW